MVVEVLHPQDCLKHPSTQGQGLLSLPMHYRNPNPTRAPFPQPDRRKPRRKPARSNSTSPVQKAPTPLLTGPIKILKRGEELPPAQENRSPPKQKVPDLGSTARSGLINPKKAPKKQTRLSDPVKPNPALKFYAGPSSSIAAPPPSSLPLPSFFAKKSSVVSSTDEGASGILKLLGLNLS